MKGERLEGSRQGKWIAVWSCSYRFLHVDARAGNVEGERENGSCRKGVLREVDIRWEKQASD